MPADVRSLLIPCTSFEQVRDLEPKAESREVKAARCRKICACSYLIRVMALFILYSRKGSWNLGCDTDSRICQESKNPLNGSEEGNVKERTASLGSTCLHVKRWRILIVASILSLGDAKQLSVTASYDQEIDLEDRSMKLKFWLFCSSLMAWSFAAVSNSSSFSNRPFTSTSCFCVSYKTHWYVWGPSGISRYLKRDSPHMPGKEVLEAFLLPMRGIQFWKWSGEFAALHWHLSTFSLEGGGKANLLVCFLGRIFILLRSSQTLEVDDQYFRSSLQTVRSKRSARRQMNAYRDHIFLLCAAVALTCTWKSASFLHLCRIVCKSD